MIDKLYKLIFFVSLLITVAGVAAFTGWLLFGDYFTGHSTLEDINGFLFFISPFAPAGTLFGILKENQTTRKKVTVILLTGLASLFLFVFIWGSLYAELMAR